MGYRTMRMLFFAENSLVCLQNSTSGCWSYLLLLIMSIEGHQGYDFEMQLLEGKLKGFWGYYWCIDKRTKGDE